MERLQYNLSLISESYEKDFKDIIGKIDHYNNASFLFESFLSEENNLSAFIESETGSAINQISALTSLFLGKVSSILSQTSMLLKEKANALKQRIGNKKIKSDKKIKMTPYEFLSDFYSSAIKELLELTYGPSNEEKFKDFCAKFSKKKRALREQEKKHQQKCFKVAVAFVAIGLFVSPMLDSIEQSCSKSAQYVKKADAFEQKAAKEYNLSVKHESGETGMSPAEKQKAFKMISSEISYYSNKLVSVAKAAYSECESAVNEFMKEYKKEVVANIKDNPGNVKV